MPGISLTIRLATSATPCAEAVASPEAIASASDSNTAGTKKLKHQNNEDKERAHIIIFVIFQTLHCRKLGAGKITASVMFYLNGVTLKMNYSSFHAED